MREINIRKQNNNLSKVYESLNGDGAEYCMKYELYIYEYEREVAGDGPTMYID